MAGQFLASSFLFNFFSQPETWVCLPESRNLTTCPQVLAPVCSVFTCGTSPNGYCERTHDNPCVACSDPTVAGWVAGGCGANPVRTCSTYERTSGCEMQVEGGSVCGLSAAENFQLNATLFQVSCDACNTTGVHFTLGGRTQEQCAATGSQTICRPQDRNRTDCPTEGATPACAFYSQGCTGPLCHRDEPSGCQACAADGVLFYSDGPCDTVAPVVPVQEAAPISEESNEESNLFEDVEGRLLFQDDEFQPNFDDFIW